MSEDKTPKECPEAKGSANVEGEMIPKPHNTNFCPNCNPYQDDPYLAFLRET